MRKNRQAGFTLIELLVVIAIIGLLASIVLTSVNTARKLARDAKRKADIKQIDTAIQAYVIDKDHAPYVGKFNCKAENPSNCQTAYDYSDQWVELAKDLAPYATNISKDPCGIQCGGDGYYYVYGYVTPSAMSQWCINIGCGLGTTELNYMYQLWAEHLESGAAKWGENHGFGLSL